MAASLIDFGMARRIGSAGAGFAQLARVAVGHLCEPELRPRGCAMAGMSRKPRLQASGNIVAGLLYR
jgi:hypothetical protein